MKRIAIFTFCFFTLLSAIYIWKNHLPKNYSILKPQSNSESVKKVDRTINTNPSKKAIAENKNKAYAEIVVNKETGKEEVVVHVPKGMHLYDENKMKEVATNGNLETFYREE